MNNLSKNKNKQIANYIKNWFESIDLDNKNVWNRDTIAAMIKNIVVSSKHWKNLPRGNARKAFNKMKENQLKKK